jgi:hypothetical protein
MKQLAYVFSAGLAVSMLVFACDSSSSSGGTGTFGGSAGAAGGNNAGNGNVAGTTSQADGGSGGAAGSTAAGAGGTEPFGGGGTAGSGTAGTGGTNASGSGGSSTAGSGGSSSGQTCQECQQTECNAELAKCSQNQSCVAAIQCANQCQDQACFQKCLEDNPDGAADLQSLAGCVQNNCAEPCGGGSDDPCVNCQQTECSSEIQACTSDPACVAAIQCINQCQDQACFQKCLEDNPDGASEVQALAGCVQNNCASECQ